MPKVKFIKEKKEIEVPEGTNLRKAAMEAGVEVYSGIHKIANCRGLGLCTSCCMNVKNGTDNVSKQGLWEKLNMLKCLLPIFPPQSGWGRIEHEKELRLGCQTKVFGDVEVETHPEFNWHGEKFWS